MAYEIDEAWLDWALDLYAAKTLKGPANEYILKDDVRRLIFNLLNEINKLEKAGNETNE